ncbi:MAG: thiamine phosphate synthase [Kofleriaceae bacterium]
MNVVLITDPALAWEDLPARVAAILAGVPRDSIAVQVRAKDLDGGAVLAMTRALLATGAEVWVNDRLDVALAAGATGVHLPAHGLAVEDARAIAKLKIGCSRHSAAAALACGADLVQLGPVFDTPGKRPLGLEPLAEFRAASSATLVAVGGIDSEERASLAAAAGADAVAVIRAAWIGPDPVAAIRALVAGVEAGRALR